MKTAAAIALLCQLLALDSTSVSACLTEAEIRGDAIHSSSLYRRQIGRGNKTDEGTIPIGVGDRFRDGAMTPIGIGSQVPANLTTVYNVAEIESAARALVREYNLEFFEAPFKTYENATMFGIKVPSTAAASNAGSGANFTVLLEAGIHARERGGPDHLLNFISDLLWAETHGAGLIYGGVEYTAAEVQTARTLGFVALPLVNPDGVAHDHATNSCWRKNRNPASAVPNDTLSVGIDLNRNFPPAWDYHTAMAPNTTEWTISDEASSSVFRGTAPLSEPEAQNVVWTMDLMQDLRWFLDLHSMAGMMLYGWGLDTNQGKDKSMNLLNEAYDGKRGAIPNNRAAGYVYSEYYDSEQYLAATITATSVADAMLAAGGRNYFAQQSAGLYPAPGSSADHPMFRALQDPAKGWANGFTLEFGQANEEAKCQFYPTVEMHQLNMMEAGAGFMEFLLSAAKFS
ncbi:zinc carboxypeptidase [Immersiella caudata]|uniref:Zinc carboxypeptidase n=1 Tax=Immersiella caudata TaxID=314043 RepID=A0AA39U407_9PEZI|nr:zinc carboxypeptidase [Immersiella caudata]